MDPEEAVKDERELIEAIQRAMASGSRLEGGVEEALNAMFAEHHRDVLRYCRSRRYDRAEDLAQEVMLIAYRKLPEFRRESSFRTWLLGIAHRVCSRDRERRQDLLTEDGVIEEQDPAMSPLKVLSQQERIELVREAAVRSLDALEQEAVELRYIHELPREDIERILKLDNASGARGLLVRCRHRLKKAILQLLEERHHGLSLLVTTLSAT
jgi:RNA polymerase sigma-70 factor (ECF subfamily)